MKIISKRGRAQAPQINIDQTLEKLLCELDSAHFINNYILARHPIKGTVPLKLHDYQEDLLQAVEQNHNVIAVMPRQAGTTSLMVARLLWEAMFADNSNIMIFAPTSGGAVTIGDLMHFQVQHVPDWLKPKTKTLSRTTIEFDNGSQLTIIPCSSHGLRGVSSKRIYLDSFASTALHTQRDTWLSLATLIAKGASCIVASTPNSSNDTFATVWADSQQRHSIFFPFKRTIDDLKQFDATWKQMMKGSVGSSVWAREFEF